ncbi:MAG: hypothetical protein M0O96_07600 [Desulforhopalus sp.]|nr:hypothetical protein [Desulforhopalus sp.]
MIQQDVVTTGGTVGLHCHLEKLARRDGSSDGVDKACLVSTVTPILTGMVTAGSRAEELEAASLYF